MLAPISSFFVRDSVVIVWQQSIIGWIIIGLLAGWLAGKLSRGRGYGCITDLVLGILGSFIGGWIFVKIGLFGGGFLYSLAAATVGAIILVSIAHLLAGGDR